jgi:hypothetical protein
MYVNPLFAGAFGTAVYDANLGPLGNISTSNYSFNPTTPVTMAYAQIRWLNTATFNTPESGGCFCLSLTPQVSMFLVQQAWCGLPGTILTTAMDPRGVPWQLPTNGDLGFSDIPTNAEFSGDWVL